MSFQIRSKNFAAASIFVAFSCISSLSHSYSLEDALFSAHEANNGILSEKEKLNAFRAARLEAYSSALPDVSINSTFAQSKTKFDKQINSNKNTTSHKFVVSQNLFAGGATVAAVKGYEQNLIAQENSFKSASNNLSVQVVKAYEGYLNAKEVLELNDLNIKVVSETLEKVKTLYDAGQVTITDVLVAEARFSEAKAGREQAHGDLRIAEASFARVVGQKVPESLEKVDMSEISFPSSIDELISICLENNPDFKARVAQYEASKSSKDSAIAQLLPKINAGAEFNRTDGNFAQKLQNDVDSVFITMKVPLFQGGAEYSKIYQAKHNEMAADYAQRDIKTAVEQSAVSAWNQFKTARSIIIAREENILGAEKAYEAVKEEVSVGTKTTIDLLDRERELFNAKVALRQAQSNLIISAYTMLQLMGAIDAVDIDL